MFKAPDASENRFRSGLTLLAAGALLDATSRLGVRAHTFVVLAALVVAALVTRGTRVHVPMRGRSTSSEDRTGFASLSPRVTALTLSGILATAEIVRFIRRGSHSGFPIWLSDLFHEDNSTWILNGTSTSSGNGLTAWSLGFGSALVQAALNGTGILIAGIQGIPPSSVGVAVTGVGLAYVLLVVICPLLVLPVANVVWVRTRSFLTASSVLVALTLVIGRFMREVREIGHLSAGLTVLGLLYSVLVLASESSDDGQFKGTRFGLWAFSFSCLLWFPLRPLALVFAAWALLDSWTDEKKTAAKDCQNRWSRLIPIVLFIAVALRAFPDIRSYLSPSNTSYTRMLLNATGGTYESFDFFLLTAALAVACVMLRPTTGTPRERGVLGLLTAYAVGIRFMDQMASPEFEYGSTKLLWVMVPTLILMSTAILTRDLPIRGAGTPSWSAALLVLCLLLANSTSFYGSVRVLGPLLWSDVDNSFIELSYAPHEDDVTQWDEPGGLDLTASPNSLPIVCVMVDERAERPIPLWEFEPYRCTRKMSEMSLEILRNTSDEAGNLDRVWMGYALMAQPLLSAVMSSANSTSDLSRDVLVLGRDGGILRQDRAIDLLAQIALSDPVSVDTAAGFDAEFVASVAFSIDSIDLKLGEVSLWADRGVERVLLITDSPVESLQVERTARPDVADLIGRSNLLSGVSFSHPSVNENLRCVVLIDREGNGTLAWSKDGGCSL